jgi:hypothetical protein
MKNLWQTEKPVDWSISLSRTQPSDFPSRASVFEAAKVQAERITRELLEGLTALSNTAVKFTIHGAEVTVFDSLENVAHVLASEFFDDFNVFDEDAISRFEDLGPAKFYGRLLKGPCGIFIRAENKLGASHVSIEFKGESFEVYGMAPFARLLTRLHESGQRWHCTRLDNAWDGVEFTPDKVFRALKRGHVRSLAQRDTITQFDTPFGENAGKTTYFGRRGSADFLRVYDRRETGTRLEHECRRGRAKLLGLMLVHTPLARWHEIGLAHLRDFVDFVKRSPDENVTRAKPLKFWSKFVGSVERIHVSMSDLASTLKVRAEQTAVQIQSVVKSLSRRANVILRAVGQKSFLSMLSREEVRLRPSDEARAADMKTVLATAAELYECSVLDILGGVGGRPLLSGGMVWRPD